MREELERIWQSQVIAYPCHVAGWLPHDKVWGKVKPKKYFSNILCAVRCRQLKPDLKNWLERQKRRILKQQQLV